MLRRCAAFVTFCSRATVRAYRMCRNSILYSRSEHFLAKLTAP